MHHILVVNSYLNHFNSVIMYPPLPIPYTVLYYRYMHSIRQCLFLYYFKKNTI